MDLSQRAHPHHASNPQKSQPPTSPSLSQHPARNHPYGTGDLPNAIYPLSLNPGSVSTSPISASHRLPSVAASTTSRSAPNDYVDGDEDESPTVDGEEPAKKKQKRNKPTLSCHECVERKTKVSQQLMPIASFPLLVYIAFASL